MKKFELAGPSLSTRDFLSPNCFLGSGSGSGSSGPSVSPSGGSSGGTSGGGSTIGSGSGSGSGAPSPSSWLGSINSTSVSSNSNSGISTSMPSEQVEKVTSGSPWIATVPRTARVRRRADFTGGKPYHCSCAGALEGRRARLDGGGCGGSAPVAGDDGAHVLADLGLAIAGEFLPGREGARVVDEVDEEFAV